MKILIYSQPFYPIIGGSVATTHYLAIALSERGHCVTVITTTLNPGVSSNDVSNTAYTIIRTNNYIDIMQNIRMSDCIVIKGGLSKKIGLLSLLLFKKYIPYFEGSSPLIYNGGFSDILRNTTTKFIASKAYFSIAVSNYAWHAQLLTNDYEHYVVQNPVNPQLEEKIVSYGVSDLIKRPIDFSYIGSITIAKGAQVFLKALSIIDAKGIVINVNIVGPILELHEEIKTTICSFKNVICSVSCANSQEELHEVYSSTKCLVNPSMMSEGSSLTIIDAFIYGMPIIMSNHPALIEVAGNAGVSFRVGDSLDLANTMERLLTNRSLMLELSDNSFKRYDEHRFEKWKNKIWTLPEFK